MELGSTTVDVGAPRRGDLRHPWTQWVLTLVTVGIWAPVHHYRINRELRDFGVDVDPVLALFAFVPGVLLVVPCVATVVRTGRRIGVAQETAGLHISIRPWVCALGLVVGLLHVAYQQAEVNRAWQADDTGGAT